MVTSSIKDKLLTKDFWVCEKSDGVRCICFITWNSLEEQQEVWLVSVAVHDARCG